MKKEIKSLSERIKQLKKELKDNAKLNDAQIDGITRMIEFMDREFIGLLRREGQINCWGYFDDIIDKLAGPDLIRKSIQQL